MESRALMCMTILFAALTIGSSATAQTFTTLYSGVPQPLAALVQGPDGNFYGTALGGNGSIFQITPAGAYTTIYTFCSLANCADGMNPYAPLVLAPDGNFYGTTSGVGINPSTVFRITPDGVLTTLYSFCAPGCTTFWGDSTTGLVQGHNGNFYGTTQDGGGSSSCTDGCGTIFEITTDGRLTVLHAFQLTDGVAPSDLILVADGNFYGTTLNGGVSNNCPNTIGGCGTFFEMTPKGALTTLYSFCSLANCTDGAYPEGVIQAANGEFYGLAAGGGKNDLGAFFKITSAGKLTVLHDLVNGGSSPEVNDDVIQGTDGSFYAPITGGGHNGDGTVVEFSPGGAETVLHKFCEFHPECPDGAAPRAALLQATDGNFYGTTSSGTVFSISMGLAPFVQMVPTFGKAGAQVTILGTDFTGATSLTFNGVSAGFSVVSATEIKTSVPIDATTGSVRVVTPSGTLSSNVTFRVTP